VFARHRAAIRDPAGMASTGTTGSHPRRVDAPVYFENPAGYHATVASAPAAPMPSSISPTQSTRICMVRVTDPITRSAAADATSCAHADQTHAVPDPATVMSFDAVGTHLMGFVVVCIEVAVDSGRATHPIDA
jgi:hypothetical protein